MKNKMTVLILNTQNNAEPTVRTIDLNDIVAINTNYIIPPIYERSNEFVPCSQWEYVYDGRPDDFDYKVNNVVEFEKLYDELTNIVVNYNQKRQIEIKKLLATMCNATEMLEDKDLIRLSENEQFVKEFFMTSPDAVLALAQERRTLWDITPETVEKEDLNNTWYYVSPMTSIQGSVKDALFELAYEYIGYNYQANTYKSSDILADIELYVAPRCMMPAQQTV